MAVDKQRRNQRLKEMGFQKGKSGNPAGRPKKGTAITDLLKEYLEGCEPGKEVTRKQLFIEAVFKAAVKKLDVAAIREILNRIDGPMTQKMDLQHDIGKNFVDIIRKAYERKNAGDK